MKRMRYFALALVLIMALTGAAAPRYVEPPAWYPQPDAETEATPAPEADHLFTEDELTAVMEQARDFYMDWFYDRAGVIDPVYADFMEYPPFDQDGNQPVYPVSVPGIETYDDLLAAASVHFHRDIAEQFLEEIGARDQDGRLCVVKSDGLGGVDFTCSLTVRRAQDGYGFDLSYAMAWDPQAWEDVQVRYCFADGHWAFTGEPEDVHQFFVVLLYAAELETDFLL